MRFWFFFCVSKCRWCWNLQNTRHSRSLPTHCRSPWTVSCHGRAEILEISAVVRRAHTRVFDRGGTLTRSSAIDVRGLLRMWRAPRVVFCSLQRVCKKIWMEGRRFTVRCVFVAYSRPINKQAWWQHAREKGCNREEKTFAQASSTFQMFEWLR